MALDAAKEIPGGDRHPSPSLLIVAIVHTLLVIAALAGSTLVAGGSHFPSPFQSAELSNGFFSQHPDALRLGALLMFGSTVPLGIFAVTAASRLRFLGVNVAGISIAMFGGIAAPAMLALSALAEWTLSFPGVLTAPSTTRALHLLTFATGGPGFIVPFGLLVAGISVAAGLARLIPRWLMWFGLGIATVAEFSSLTLMLEGAAYLLPVARMTGFVWLICVGAILPKSRAMAAAKRSGRERRIEGPSTQQEVHA